MRTVIYDSEMMEPITIVNIPQDLFAGVEKGTYCGLTLPIYKEVSSLICTEPVQKISKIPACHVTFEPVRRNGATIFWLCLTDDAESALLLRSVFLPGQQKEVEDERREAFLKGLRSALSAF